MKRKDAGPGRWTFSRFRSRREGKIASRTRETFRRLASRPRSRAEVDMARNMRDLVSRLRSANRVAALGSRALRALREASSTRHAPHNDTTSRPVATLSKMSAVASAVRFRTADLAPRARPVYPSATRASVSPTTDETSSRSDRNRTPRPRGEGSPSTPSHAEHLENRPPRAWCCAAPSPARSASPSRASPARAPTAPP